MKAGDRVLITIGDAQHMCAVIESESKMSLLLVNEDGEQVATIQQFWRKTTPVFDTVRDKHVQVMDTALTGKKPNAKLGVKGTSIKCCEAPGCDSVYNAKRADLARGWGKTCSKSCAAKLREFNKNANR